MKTHIANIITGIRILGNILLAFVPVFSAAFYAVHLTCGLSDMADGMIARKTNNVSSFGARFDTAADFLFAAVSLVKLLPYIPVPRWLWIWITASNVSCCPRRSGSRTCNIGCCWITRSAWSGCTGEKHLPGWRQT